MREEDEACCAFCGGPIPEPTEAQARGIENQSTPRLYCCARHRRHHAKARQRDRKAQRLLEEHGRLLDPVEGCLTPDKRGIWVNPFKAQVEADRCRQQVYRCRTGVVLHYHLTSVTWGKYQRYDRPGDDIDDKLAWAQSLRDKANA